MPIYLYQHPSTGEVVEVIQTMSEPHVYSKDGVEYARVFTAPNGSADTRIDAFNSKDFVNKMGNKKCTLGNMMDESRNLSDRRAQKIGLDPVREKYLKNYSAKRKGKPHPSQVKRNIEISL